jgi:cob(I)alamin adenosyltransferase
VLLVGDIDRGGIFAQLLGTLQLFPPQERALVAGLVINKFRGDLTLFTDGIRILEERGGVPVVGVVPFLHDLGLPEEDSVALQGPSAGRPGARVDVAVAVIRLPHIANFDDFDPLSRHPGVQLRYVATVEALGRPDAVIVPGTKSTMADLAWLRERGLATALQRLAADGVAVAGICGGYQMLGRRIHDPEHVESSNSSAEGLGLLPVETIFTATKSTYRVQAEVVGSGWLRQVAGQVLEGYEIHMGTTTGGHAWLRIHQRNGVGADIPDGSMNETGRIWGCYLHGLFANDALRHAWLESVAVGPGKTDSTRFSLSGGLDRLADALALALDMRRIDRIINGGNPAMSVPDQHKERMSRRKEAFEARKAQATLEKGLLIVNTGNGKGKTTAALGMAFRALGHGMKVGIVQMIKGAIPTGEAALIHQLRLPIEIYTLGDGFTWNTQDRAADIASARKAWDQVVRLLQDESFGMVILDELNVVVHYEYLPLAEVLDVLRRKRPMLHVVVTGRHASPELIAMADLVTEMKLVKHPYREQGVKPQKGIEL